MGSVSGANRRAGWPLLRVEPVDSHPWWTWLALLSTAMIVVLAVAGLPPVDLHGPLHWLGIMDPLCGGTRSMYLTMHGHPADAVHYNPAAPLVPVATFVLLVRAVVGRLYGWWITPVMPRRVVFACCAAIVMIALVALEIHQQLNAELLTSRWPT
ncbi:DUF2752 domain-containing protein [Mycobacterium sp. AZCC_0083]|uniref:DUF2752 domain-containing protein n=1 Tax=Mycobacterium sp. AZCC_0083 TaxID=2735882 RepID=UPI00161D011B|nr:DUF2752 domain-containing protein [Mycobacterium sp. AZCC_0083]MBB5161715.1 hypothetical protein [Mycobacterium sp. AZCC_0083]